MRQIHKIFLLVVLSGLALTGLKSEIVEEIVAIVNGEVITYTEYQNAKNAMMMQLQSQYQGEKLQKAIKQMREQLLNQLIEHKLIISKAKEKNYDVDSEVNMILEEIKKQNNLKSDDELRMALQKEGITLEEFKKQQKILRLQQKMIYDEVTSKIDIDNAEIMAHYKKNIDEFTEPMEFTLNCIFLNAGYYFDQKVLEARKKEIASKLTEENFLEIAQQYSELEGGENKYFLGTYKKGELNENIEKAAMKLDENQTSSWIGTESGWYIIQLKDKKPPRQISYKEVRDKIRGSLLKQRQEEELQKFIEKIKKESHIKIVKTFD